LSDEVGKKQEEKRERVSGGEGKWVNR